MTPNGGGNAHHQRQPPQRIAKGSGTSVEEVNRLLKQFVQMQKMLKQLGMAD
jgi:signal recognition particle GTPase